MKSPIFKGATTVTWGITWGNTGLPYNMGQFGDYGPKKAVFGQNFENLFALRAINIKWEGGGGGF